MTSDTEAGTDLAARASVDTVLRSIAEAAEDLFRNREYVAVRISDIAARAEVSPTSIYARFRSKAALYRAVMDREPPEDDAVRATGRGRRTRDNLVEAGIALFDQVGYFEVTIADISDAAGCSAATFYTYFATKDELFRHVALRQSRDFFDHLWHADADGLGPEHDPRAYLRSLCDRYAAGYRRYGRVLHRLEHAAVASSDFARLLTSIRAPFLQRLGELVATWQADGTIPAHPDAERSADFVLTSLESFAATDDVVRAEQLPTADLAILLARALGLADETA